MGLLWQQQEAPRQKFLKYYGPHRSVWIDRDLLLRKALELVGQMQETMTKSVKHTRQMGCHLSNVLAIVQELVHDREQEEAHTEDIKMAEPAPILFPTIEPSTKLPKTLGSITKPTANTLGDLNPNGVLHDDGFDPTTKLEPMDEQPVTTVTQSQ